MPSRAQIPMSTCWCWRRAGQFPFLIQAQSRAARATYLDDARHRRLGFDNCQFTLLFHSMLNRATEESSVLAVYRF